MSERWRKPAVILDAVISVALVQMPSGEIMHDAKIAVDDETLERMRQGYVCANCLEPFEEPFPEVCHALKLPDGTVVGCYYRVKDRQLHDLAHRHESAAEVQIGKSFAWYDEAERLREMDAFEARSGLALPDHIKFPNEIKQGNDKFLVVPYGKQAIEKSYPRRANHVLPRG